MRTMADSVAASDIPVRRFPLVAGYVDGAYAWKDTDWLRHAASVRVRITVLGDTLDADVADVESGDLTETQGADWVKRMLAAGKLPTLYFSFSRNAQIDAAIIAAGVGLNAGWMKWWADWDGVADLRDFGVAKQYANPTLSGGHYDLSVVRDYWPGVDPVPSLNEPLSLAGLSQAQLLNLVLTLSWAQIGAQYGADAVAWLQAHDPRTLPSPTPSPPPSPLPPPPAGPPLDQARAAWARLGDLLVNAAPQAVISVEAAITKIRNLP